MSRLSDDNDEYIKEGDLILVQFKKQIGEVLVKDLSPSGDYMRVTSPAGHNSTWVNCIHHIETLVSGEEDDTEYVDVTEEEDLIGDEWKDTKVELLGDEEAEVITQNTLAAFDKRNSRNRPKNRSVK